jgi:hypothetical protein
MTEHMVDSILRRELRLERVLKYVKKNIKELNNKKVELIDYERVRGLYNTKSILIEKMLSYLDKYSTTNNVKDKLLVAIIGNVIEEIDKLDSGIMTNILKLIDVEYGIDSSDSELYGSSYDGGYDSH